MTDLDTIRVRHHEHRGACAWCGNDLTGDRPWPCDTRVVLDALNESKADTLRMGHNWEDALTQRDAARADAERLAEALREHLEHYYDCWADGTEYLVYNGTPDTSDLRAALRQHDAAKEAEREERCEPRPGSGWSNVAITPAAGTTNTPPNTTSVPSNARWKPTR